MHCAGYLCIFFISITHLVRLALQFPIYRWESEVQELNNLPRSQKGEWDLYPYLYNSKAGVTSSRVTFVADAFCGWCCSLPAADLPRCPQWCPVMWTLWPSQTVLMLSWPGPAAHIPGSMCQGWGSFPRSPTHRAYDWPLGPCARVSLQCSCGQTSWPKSYHPKPLGLPQPSLGPWLTHRITSPLFSPKQVFIECLLWTRLNTKFWKASSKQDSHSHSPHGAVSLAKKTDTKQSEINDLSSIIHLTHQCFHWDCNRASRLSGMSFHGRPQLIFHKGLWAK